MVEKSVVATAAWISVALIIITLFWTPKSFDMFAAIVVVFILLAIPFVLSLILFSKEIR